VTGAAVASPDLSAEEHQHVLATRILPAALHGAVAQERPVAVWVAGQPGSGKTGLAEQVHTALGRRGGAVLVGSDLFKRHHPGYGAFLEDDDLTAGERVRAVVRAWQEQVEELARASRLDVVVETALAEVDPVRAAARAYRAAGYRLELVVLAVAEPVSQLAVAGRYLRQAAAAGGRGRFVGWGNHDRCAAALPAVVRVIEDDLLADRVTVVDRTKAVLYVNELATGSWMRRPGAASAVRAERSRPWTAVETARFRAEQAEVELLRGHPQVRELPARVAGTGLERAAALAEPVRRTAQVSAGRAGVDFHRLSPEEHTWTFEEWIWPSYEPLVRRQEHPVAVYVMGQPGAGKTGVSTMVKRGLSGRGALVVQADMLKVAHPDFADLMEADPRTAGSKVRADVKGWQRAFEARLRAARSDVVIEVAPGSARQLLDSAGAFARVGYRVELVVLGVRAADSLLGTATRCADLLRAGLWARFTARTGHDVCFRAVADALEAAERESVFAQVMVVDRDGHPLYRSRRDQYGRLDRAPTADVALAAARTRPYTETEAHVFGRELARMWGMLPQYQDELLATAALAGPLLPPRMRPPLPAPVPGAAAKAALVARTAPLLRLGQLPVAGLVAGGHGSQLGGGEVF